MKTPQLVLISLLLCEQPIVAVAAQNASPKRRIEPISGQFLSEGHPVDEVHCELASQGPHPAVVLINGCARIGFGEDEYKQMRKSLAENGYYPMFVGIT